MAKTRKIDSLKHSTSDILWHIIMAFVWSEKYMRCVHIHVSRPLNQNVSSGMNSNPFFNVTESIYEQFGLRIKDFNLPKYINKFRCFCNNENRISAPLPPTAARHLNPTCMRNGQNDSLIIDRLFWVPPAKPKINYYWWKLCTLSMFGFIVWSKQRSGNRAWSISVEKYSKICSNRHKIFITINKCI